MKLVLKQQLDALTRRLKRAVFHYGSPPLKRALFRKYSRRLRATMDSTWCLDTFRVEDDFIEIQGWALAPQRDPSGISFAINDRFFDHVSFPGPRKDIERIFWFLPQAKMSAFACRANIPRRDAFSKGHAVINCVDGKTRAPLNDDHNFYCNDPEANELPVPNAGRRRRVQGGESDVGFRIDGFSTYMKLGLALRKAVNRNLDDFSSILDWGCGCGRVVRHMRDLERASITGVDIDEDNVSWCRRHLSFGRFSSIPLHPPTPLEDASFDLLIGVSVFTHLREKEQFEWLEELRRIASEGAILLLSIHGEASVARGRLQPEHYFILQHKGFLDAGPSGDLEGELNETGYYRTTFHTRKYIDQTWSEYFEIIDWIPGYLTNHQDLLVLRKSGAAAKRASSP